MDPEELSKTGEFEQALEALATRKSGAARLMRFSLQVRLQRFDEALATIKPLGWFNPFMIGVFRELAACARSEQAMVRRLVDVRLARERTTIGVPSAYAFRMVQVAERYALGDAEGAGRALTDAHADRAITAGLMTLFDGSKLLFDDLEDSDDLTGSVLPIYRNNEVTDLAYSELATVRMFYGRTSFDVQWIPVVATTWGRQQVQGRIPSLYPGSGVHVQRGVRTGEQTVWRHEHGCVVGSGQRTLKAHQEPGKGHLLVGFNRVAELRFGARKLTRQTIPLREVTSTSRVVRSTRSG